MGMAAIDDRQRKPVAGILRSGQVDGDEAAIVLPCGLLQHLAVGRDRLDRKLRIKVELQLGDGRLDEEAEDRAAIDPVRVGLDVER